MAKVTFPFRVKNGGRYYASGEIVEVDDVEDAIKDGATLIPEAHKTAKEVLSENEEHQKRGKAKKT